MKFRPYLTYFIIALSIFLFGKLAEENILFPRFNQSYVQRFQKIYISKEKELNKIMMELSVFLKKTRKLQANDLVQSKHIGLLERRGLAVFVYENDSLKLWSDNSVPISPIYSGSNIDSSLVHLKNGWYVPRTIHLGKYTLVGLILIKHVYTYENKFLTSSFQKDFNASPSVKISSGRIPGSYPIIDCHNRFIFSLVFDKDTYHHFFQAQIPSAAYFFLILYLLWVIYQPIRNIARPAKRNLAIVITAVLLIITKIIMLYFQIPGVFYNLELFKPQYFAASYLIPSLGDLLLWAVFIFALVIIYYKSFYYQIPFSQQKWILRLKLFLRLSAVIVFFYVIFFLIKSIILNSTISFEANKLLLFDSYSFFGYIVVMLLFVSLTLIVDKVLLLYRDHVSFKIFFLLFGFTVAIWGVIFQITGNPVHPVAFIFIIVLVTYLMYVRLLQKTSYSYSMIVLVVFMYSVFTVFIVTRYSYLRSYNQKKVLVTNLATEHDPVAEYILREVNGELNQDTAVYRMISSNEIFLDHISAHLRSRYLGGYFEKYNLDQITICTPEDSVYLNPPDNTWSQCYNFFSQMIREKGSRIANTNFYFINNMNGRISYLGWFEYRSAEKPVPVSIFIELVSKNVSEELGYPELLLDNRFGLASKFKDFSYAKYYDGKLTSQYGLFSYNLSSRIFEKNRKEYITMRSGGYDHLVYHPSKESTIVLSSPALTALDIAIFFSYTFVVYFLITTLVVVLINLPLVRKIFEPNFKNKIQYTMMSLLFISLILIGSGTLYFSKRQYFNKHHEIVTEKLQSIYYDLTQKLAQEQKIEPQWKSYQYENLNDLLVKSSNIFYIDINLYDPEGNLLGTSRPEIFEKGLIGTKMNAEAYAALVNDTKAEVVINEKIGNLRYISAYVPFKNKDNKILAYLNVPYFTKQEELTHEVSTMVVAAVNIYVLLLLLASVIAVFFARKITLPLRLIQSKFSEIKLGQHYEKINYTANDEIGGLVAEYNRMVSELEKSVEMLAKSERESAWREMAKQIAHEINNPLTPMKLSVQHLLRAWKDKNDRFEDYLEKISHTLIDEIDSLSSIATEFSNFAKMPKAISQPLDLITKINNAVSLFSSDEVDFTVNLNGLKEINVYADKEQISRVFINLFKNAIQSVEKDVKPQISVDVKTTKNWVQVFIKDNGKGIPLSMRDRLFRPNFTTKSSGMGLGLAIVKNIIESTGGNITYETEEKKGTTFIIELPVIEKKVKSDIEPTEDQTS